MDGHGPALSAASAAGGESVRRQDLEEGGGAEGSQQAPGHGGGYGATGGEPGARRRGNRRAVAAGLLLGVAAVAAVAMLGTSGSRAPGTGGSRTPGLVSLASRQELQSVLEEEGEGDPSVRTLPQGTGPNAPLTLSPEEDPEQDPGAMDVDAQTDMAPKGEKIGFAMEPGRSGGGLEYPRSAKQFYDHMLYNANLSLQENKGWRYWSRIRVRDEVYYMTQKVENLIKRNYAMHYEVKQNLEADRSNVKADVDVAQAKMTDLVREVKTVAEKIGAGLTALRQAEEEEQRRLEHYKGHYDRDLRRIHAVLSNQTIELEKERHDALRKAYDKQLAKMQEDVDSILAEDRAQMVKNNEESRNKIQAIQDQLDRDSKDMSDLQRTIYANVEDAKEKEISDMQNVSAVHASLQTYLQHMKSSLDESLQKQAAIEAVAKANQEALAEVTTEVHSAAFKLDMLQQKQAKDHEEVDEKLKSLVTTSDGLDSKLTTDTATVASLKETVDQFAAESPEFKKTVEGDHAALKSTIDGLMNEIKKADKLKQDISDLQISMNTQINDIASKIDDLGGTQSTLATSLGGQKTDMANMQTRIATLEQSAKSSSDQAKADHDRVSAVVTEMQSKLTTLLDLKDRIEELQSSVSANVNDLQSKITDAEATRNSTRDSLLDFLERLKGDLAGQAQNEQQAETNTSVAIAQFQTELEALNSFKADSEKSAAELVKKLTDTTESLSILDSKFSGQHRDLDSKISSLQESVNKVPTKVEFEKTIQDAMDTADKAEKKLAEVGKDVASIRADQTLDDGRILSLNGAADAQSSTNDKNWKDIMDMIQEEGDLFSKISKKLKDEELSKDVDTVFGRSGPAAQ